MNQPSQKRWRRFSLSPSEGEKAGVKEHFGFRICTRRAFTLIELILVMAILTVAIAIAAPALSRFFRGRTLDSQARMLLALTRHGQSRAVAEGVPMELWLDAPQATFGLEAEPSYETSDPKKLEFHLENDMQLQVIAGRPVSGGANMSTALASASATPVPSTHPNLRTIRFLPDGSISETSPVMLRLIGREGDSLWLAQSRSRLAYEIRTANN